MGHEGTEVGPNPETDGQNIVASGFGSIPAAEKQRTGQLKRARKPP